jgi:hypothetical protein
MIDHEPRYRCFRLPLITPTPSPRTSPACPRLRRPVPPAHVTGQPRLAPLPVHREHDLRADAGHRLRSIAASCSPLCSVHTRCGPGRPDPSAPGPFSVGHWFWFCFTTRISPLADQNAVQSMDANPCRSGCRGNGSRRATARENSRRDRQGKGAGGALDGATNAR